MPTITFLEAGTNATYGTQFWTVGGTVTSDATVVHTGLRSLKCAVAGTAQTPAASLASAGRRISFYAQFAALPGTFTYFGVVQDASSNPQMALRLDSAGVLKLVNGADAQLGGNGPTLSTGIWYRVTVAYTITSSSVYEARVFVNGTLAITVSNGASLGLAGPSDNFRFGSFAVVSYYSDIYVDDGTTLDDPGDIRVTAKLPASVNTGNFGTTVGNGAVNERPLSETNGMEDTTTSGDQQNYTLQAAAVGDVDVSAATIVGRSAWIWAKVSVASVAAKIMDNGSESAVTLTTSSALYTLLTTSASYPSNAAGIGMRSSTTANTFLYECGTLIAYIPGAGGIAMPVAERHYRAQRGN